MRRERALVKNTLIISIGTFVPRIASIITLPILTGYLTKEEYGEYDLILTLVSLFLPALTLQIQTAAFRFLIEKKKKEEQKRIISSILFFSICVSFFSLLVFSFFLRLHFSLNIILLCVYYFSDNICGVERQISRGLSKNLLYSTSVIVSSFVQLLLVILLVYRKGLGLRGAIIALTVSEMISFLFLFITTGSYKLIGIQYIRKQTIRELISYSWPMVPNSLCLWVMRLSDRLVITAFLGVGANAVYAVANKIPSLLSIAQSTFTMAWQENASIASKDNDVDKYYSQMFNSMFRFYVGVFGLLIALSPFLFKLLIRGNYEGAYYQMPILFLGVFFNCLTAFLGGIYVALKKTRTLGITTFFAAICNLSIDFLLVNLVGIYAGSISTLISYMSLYIFRLFDLKKMIRITYDIRLIVMGFSIMIIESILCFTRMFSIDLINCAIGVVSFCFLNANLLSSLIKEGKKVLKNDKT